MEDKVVLVDTQDREIGAADKLQAHREGALHRAFSIFVFNARGQLLLQKRARAKYHSGGLWTNTCCGHPRPAEPLDQAARRRLREEMGFDCRLDPVFSFTYNARVGDGLIEHEYDHVFIGQFDGNPAPNPAEVEDWTWADVDPLRADIRAHPDRYTHWFKICVDAVLSHPKRTWRLANTTPASPEIPSGLAPTRARHGQKGGGSTGHSGDCDLRKM